MRLLPGSRPGHKATIFDEATRLLEDGFTREMVLAEYPGERDWLDPMLGLSHDIELAVDAEPASYYFEASLKSRFLEAARERRYRPAPARSATGSRVRSMVATATVLTGTASAGVVTYGFVTADQAVPGDWNYGFKQTTERIEYALARGDDRVEIQINQAQARVYEIKILNERGSQVSVEQIQRVEREASQLRSQIEKSESVNPIQQAQLRALQEITTAVLDDVKKKDERVRPAADSALTAVSEAVAAGGGGTTVGIPEPTATPATAATSTATAPASPSPTATATTETPTAQPTRETPTATATVETPTPSPTAETPTVEPTATATATATEESATPPPAPTERPSPAE